MKDLPLLCNEILKRLFFSCYPFNFAKTRIFPLIFHILRMYLLNFVFSLLLVFYSFISFQFHTYFFSRFFCQHIPFQVFIFLKLLFYFLLLFGTSSWFSLSISNFSRLFNIYFCSLKNFFFSFLLLSPLSRNKILQCVKSAFTWRVSNNFAMTDAAMNRKLN